MIAKVVPTKRMPLKLSVLDYFVPFNLQKKIKVGQLVRIPFRTKEIFGVVNSVDDNAQRTNKIKDVVDIIFSNPVLSQFQLDFIQEISLLYHCSLGFLLKNNSFIIQICQR